MYGEIENSSRLAAAIVEKRQQQEISTTRELREVIIKLAPRGKDHQYFARVFQALRIEVNQELEGLKSFLEKSAEVLKEGGRLVVIAYHSLEDRLVKNFLKSGNFEGKLHKDFYGNVEKPFKLIGNKPLIPDDVELERNPRSRSAKLRIAEKC